MRNWVVITALCAVGGCYGGVNGGGGADSDGPDSAGTDGNTAAETDGETGTGTDSDGAVDGDPGRVTLHRLNRAEYNNTIRDLFFGLDVTPADQFPADDHSLGFDNIADALNVTPLLFELYERAAQTTIDEALALATDAGDPQRFEAEVVGGDVGSECCGGYWNLFSTGEIQTSFDVAGSGSHEIRIMAAGQQAGPDLPNMAVIVDGLEVGSFDVDATLEAPAEYVLELELDAGTHAVSVGFTNDFYDEGTGGDRNLLVDFFEVVPLEADGEASSIRDKIVVCDPVPGDDGACDREILDTFAQRAWRRPVTEAELDTLQIFVGQAVDEGGTWEDGIRTALTAVLVSPHFVFRVELDADPESPEPHALNDWELASRLSYFVWSSMPDEALFESARAGELSDPAVAEQHVRRMLGSDKAQALVANFAGQWLYTRAVGSDLVKDYQTFPDWDEELRDAMRSEMEMFTASFITGGRPLDELLTAKNTFVNDRLAAFYGLDPVGSDDVVEVSLMGKPRKGLLTQAGLMSVLAHPNVTSPVKRGKWVLEQLLCIEPPPPPPEVEATVEPTFDEGPMRERLAQHREDPSCAVCHRMLDPVGLAFEHYDGVGAWRDQEGPWEIDASGQMPAPLTGTFDDALEMVDLIAASDEFARCAVEKALTYGLGRGVENDDDAYVEEITAKFIDGGLRFEDLVVAITLSDVFRARRGEPQQ